jgi:DNA-binding transcriptional MerR regulator
LIIPKHVLRFWEGKFSQLRPMKRGGGRRYYRPEDVDLLRGIRSLLYDEGYTIKGVQRILRGNGVCFVKECWRSNAVKGDDSVSIPDLAKDAAEARRENFSALIPVEGEAVRATLLTPEDRLLLTNVLKELEECRNMLKDANKAL